MTSPYQHSGTLSLDVGTYVPRPADEELYQALKQGDYCSVLNARQTGKSSLRVRVMNRLEAEDGFTCAHIDLSSKQKQNNVTPEKWYTDIFYDLVEDLGLVDFDLVAWKQQPAQQQRTPLGQFKALIETVILPQVSGSLVIFIDEIDSVLSLDFPADDLLTFIRGCYNRRADDPRYKRLTFCLLGVVNPTELIQNKQITPFNIGRVIDLTPLDLETARPILQPGLTSVAIADPAQLLTAVFAWTNGQPFLTQKLCNRVIERAMLVPETEPTLHDEDTVGQWLAQLVRDEIITNWEIKDDPQHLKTIRQRLREKKFLTSRMLGVYQRVLEHEVVTADSSVEQIELRLSGLVFHQAGRLEVYNPIYAEIFNLDWIKQVLDDLKRPYSHQLDAWIAANSEDTSLLLRGDDLKQAWRWIQGRRLDDREARFLAESQALEAVQANQQRWITLRMSSVISAAILAGASAFAHEITNGASLARVEANSEVISANRFQAKALKQAQEAQRYERAAVERQHQAEQATKKADTDKRNAEKSATEAKLQLGAAAQALQETQVQATRTHKQLVKSRQTFIFEQRGLDLLQAFNAIASPSSGKPGQLQTLIQAMELAVDLEKTVPENSSYSAYSAHSPILALSQILDSIHEVSAPVATEKLGSEHGFTWVSYSPTSDELAIGTRDGSLILFNFQYKSKRKFQHIGPVRRIRYRPDGQEIAVVTDKAVTIWNLQSGNKQELQDSEEVRDVIYRPDGEEIALQRSDNRLIRLNLLSGYKQEWDYNNNLGAFRVRYHPNGKEILILQIPNDHDRSTRSKSTLWNLENGSSHEISYADYVNDMVYSPDGREVAIVEYINNDYPWEGSKITLWNLQDGSKRKELQSRGRITDVSYRPDSKEIAIVAHTGSMQEGYTSVITQWNPQDGSIYEIHNEDWVGSISYHPNGQEIAFISTVRETLSLWDLYNKSQLKLSAFSRGNLSHVTYHPEGNELLIGATDGQVISWRKKSEVLDFDDRITDLEYRPDGQEVAIGLWYSHRIILWDLQNDSKHELLMPVGERVRDISYHPSGQEIAIAGNSSITLWNLKKGIRHELRLTVQGIVTNMAYSPDGHKLVVGTSDGKLILFDLKTDHQQEFKNGGYIVSLSYRSDGQEIAVGTRIENERGLSTEGRVTLWNPSSGIKKREFKTAGLVQDVSYHPNGQELAIAKSNGLELWNLKNVSKHEFRDISNSIRAVKYSPNGQYIAVVTSGEVVLYPIGLQGLLLEGCKRLEKHFILYPEDRDRFLVCEKSIQKSSDSSNYVDKVNQLIPETRQTNLLQQHDMSIPTGTKILDVLRSDRIVTISDDKIANLWIGNLAPIFVQGNSLSQSVSQTQTLLEAQPLGQESQSVTGSISLSQSIAARTVPISFSPMVTPPEPSTPEWSVVSEVPLFPDVVAPPSEQLPLAPTSSPDWTCHQHRVEPKTMTLRPLQGWGVAR